ncbi:LysR family transcriptional regulator [Achromobacter sp. Marseille-Q4962]|uniref:LysR family transcriptional regulator n=1 Tax=Achromobacter sp. Marseille-Q4962 TaxID=2942202 RepID=UPI00207309E6|nr:LysR family transcriptional regulator [Achromobacter sp. Marseille-Q4962]
MSQLSHRHVELFRALMLAGSATRAAELLRTSQPTVSRELARLERMLGLALFERVRGRLRPTAQALALYEEVRRSYTGLERVAAAAARLRAFHDGQLAVIALPAFSHSILPGACRRFHARHPDASVSVENQESPVLEEWLSAQRYDLGLTERDAAPAGTRLETLLEVDEVCVLPAGHPLLARRAIALQDLAGQAFVCLSPSDPYRLQIDAAFAELGVAPRPVAETPTAVSVCAFVRQGLGAAIVNPLTALDFAGPHLHLRPLTRSFPFRVGMVFPEHRPANSLAADFRVALQEEVRAMRAALARQVSA